MLFCIDKMRREHWSTNITRLIHLYRHQQQQQQQKSHNSYPSTTTTVGSTVYTHEQGHNSNLHSTTNEMNENGNNSDPSTPVLWEAKLNDQDVFNAIMTLIPHYYYILPCQWNIQLHARINTFSYCLEELMSEANISVYHTQNNMHSNIDNNSIHSKSNTSSVYEEIKIDRRQALREVGIRVQYVPMNCDLSRQHEVYVCGGVGVGARDRESDVRGSAGDRESDVRGSAGDRESDVRGSAGDRESDVSGSAGDRESNGRVGTKVMHYMTGSYKGDHGFLGMCSDCWSMYDNMSWASIKAGKKMSHNYYP